MSHVLFYLVIQICCPKQREKKAKGKFRRCNFIFKMFVSGTWGQLHAYGTDTSKRNNTDTWQSVV